MPGFTPEEAKATLDVRYPTTGGTDFVAYSVNGTSEFAGLARTAIGATGWAAATSADPSVKANANALTSAAATAAGNVSHYAVFSAVSAGTQRIEWTALDSARTVAIGDQLTHAPGAIRVTLT